MRLFWASSAFEVWRLQLEVCAGSLDGFDLVLTMLEGLKMEKDKGDVSSIALTRTHRRD